MPLISCHLADFFVLIKLHKWETLMTVSTQDLEKYIIRSLPRPYICMHMNFDLFTMWIRRDTKTVSIFLPPNVTWYIGYCECIVFPKIRVLTACSLPSKYHSMRYTEDDVSVCMFKYTLSPSLLGGQCYLRALECLVYLY